MAKPKITLYDLTYDEYRKVMDAINPARFPRTAQINVDEMTGIRGDSLKYNLTLSVKTNEKYVLQEKETAIKIMKGLVSLLDFN